MGLKNIEKAQVLRLGDEVEYQQGQIVSKTLAQNRALSMTLFATCTSLGRSTPWHRR